ncbi:hypothetical protein GCM10022419_065270 [Nonomuraea rosea]|uniref:RNA polymerase sigma-70 region 4 domain-containing protein n=1 Tax=Nonomuraea rosea TaxID=638574 RepID=A0ABP6Y482_9ACTN
MTVQDITFADMTTEQLLMAMVDPAISERRRTRLRERLVETHQWLLRRRPTVAELAARLNVPADEDALPERERHILLLRFHGNLTQAEIADEFGISQMHVSRILRAPLTGLRQALTTADRQPVTRAAA